MNNPLSFQQLSGERGRFVRELLGKHDVLPLHRLVSLYGESFRDVVLRLRVHAQRAIVDPTQVSCGVGQQPSNALLGLRRVCRCLQRAWRFVRRGRGRRRRGDLARRRGRRWLRARRGRPRRVRRRAGAAGPRSAAPPSRSVRSRLERTRRGAEAVASRGIKLQSYYSASVKALQEGRTWRGCAAWHTEAIVARKIVACKHLAAPCGRAAIGDAEAAHVCLCHVRRFTLYKLADLVGATGFEPATS